jgi:hypothetical protein
VGSSNSATGTNTGAASANGSGLSGCLSGSPITGSYMLTDHSGNNYKLTGNLEAMRLLVGNEVQLTGTPSDNNSSASASTTPGSSGQAGATASASGTASTGANSGMNSSSNTGTASASSSQMKQFNVAGAT